MNKLGALTILATVVVVLVGSPALARAARTTAGGYAYPTGTSYTVPSRLGSPFSNYRTTAPVRVRGYTTQTGAYVPSHLRTTADTTQRNNWSSIPNTNPYTGRTGTRVPRY